MGRQPVVGQAIPSRKDQDLALRCEEPQAVLQPLEPLPVARHVQNVLPACGAREFCQHERIGPFRQAGDGPAASLAMNGSQRFGEW